MDDLISKAVSLIGGKRGRSPLGLQNQAVVPYVGTRGSLFSSDAALPVGDRAYNAYGSVGTLFAIVSQIGNAFASTPWHLYKRTSVRDKKKRSEILGHGFLTVWDKPNDFYTGRFFRETVHQHLDLV